jgi:hypothetical protein
MEDDLSKENIKRLLEIGVKARGVILKTDEEYILKEKGEEGLKKLEDELEKLGQPIKFQEIKTMDFYPIGLRAVSLLAIKKVFGFDDEKIKEIGLFATKTSLIIKLFVRYFLSVQRVFMKEAPRLWAKHYTVGELNTVELNEEKKYGIIRLRNINVHPIVCCYLEGYFCGILHLIIKSSRINSQESKCTFRGNEYHEYLLKWE